MDISRIHYTGESDTKSFLNILKAELAKDEYVCVNCHKICTMQRANSSRVKYLDNPDSLSLNINTEYVYDVLIEESCIDCEENNFLVLEFDHVRGSKTASISQMIRKPRTFSLDLVKRKYLNVRLDVGTVIGCEPQHDKPEERLLSKFQRIVLLLNASAATIKH